MNPLRRGFFPTDAFRDRIEHGEVLGMFHHLFAPELQRVLPNRVSTRNTQSKGVIIGEGSPAEPAA